ncbi:unnamed protein product, partial [Didymodactylos carnosus]
GVEHLGRFPREKSKDAQLAYNLSINMKDSTFIVGLCILNKRLSLTSPVVCGLQSSGDIMDCKQLIDDIIFMFKYSRNEKLEQNYEEIFDDVRELCYITGQFVKVLSFSIKPNVRSTDDFRVWCEQHSLPSDQATIHTPFVS